MSARPLVSVVLPVYNRAGVVRRAIDSVLAQTYEPLELIIVDDASTDETPAVLDRYAADQRVTIVRSSINLGAAGARNLGIEKCRGHYVAFQDSDDRWFPENVWRQLDEIEANGAEASYCAAVYCSPEHSYYVPRVGTIGRMSGDLKFEVLRGNPMSPQTMIVERSRLVALGAFDTSMSINEDWDLVIRLARELRFAFVAEPMVVIYRTPNSVSSDALADADSRELLIERYRSAFDLRPSALAHQHYVVGRQLLLSGSPRRARDHLRSAMRVSGGRSRRTVVRWIEAELRSLSQVRICGGR